MNLAAPERSDTPPAANGGTVDVVVVNYRTAELTVDCLRSLAAEVTELGNVHVWVVDNASGDGSQQRIRMAVSNNADWSRWVTVVDAGENGGFARGNNVALRTILTGPTKPDYVLLLNPDTVVRPGAIHALVDFMRRHPDAGVAGSRLEHPDGARQISAFRFHSALGELAAGLRLGMVSSLLRKWVVPLQPSDECRMVDWVSGASFMVRVELFQSVGLLDERYFMYYEETDFCLRAARAGWECWSVPQSQVLHLEGQASGVGQRKRMPAYWFESRRRYFLKNHGRLYAALADAAWASGYAAWRMRRRVQRKPDLDPPHLLVDFLRHSVFARGFRVRTSDDERGRVA